MGEKTLKISFYLSLEFFILSLLLMFLSFFDIFSSFDYYINFSILLFVSSFLFVGFFSFYLKNREKVEFYLNLFFVLSLFLILIFYILGIYEVHNYIFFLFISFAFSSMFFFLFLKKEEIYDFFERKEKENNEISLKQILFLILILIGVFFLFYFHIDYIKYVDTDEVRLMYDAKMISEGKVPFDDFQARSSVLIYLLSLFVMVFGTSLFSFYVLTCIVNIISAFLLFVLARRLFNYKIGIVSIIIFALAPIITFLLWLKTQTFLIPIILLSYIFYDVYLQKGQRKYLIFTLLLILIAMFIRENTIVYFLGFLTLIFIREKDFRKTFDRSLKLGCVFFVIVLVYVFVTMNFFTYKGFSISSTFFDFASYGIDELSLSRAEYLPYYISYAYIFLFFVSFVFVFNLFFYWRKNGFMKVGSLIGVVFPFLVIFALFAIYLFNAFRLGFWPQYFMEFIPYFSILIACVVFCFFKFQERMYFKYLGILLVSILLLVSSFSGIMEMKNYKGSMNRQGVVYLSLQLNEISKPTDIVFSGSPVYAFVSDRDHFMNLSHEYYDSYYVKIVSDNLMANPPEYIVYDDRFDKYYIKENLEYKEFFEENYYLIESFSAFEYGRNWTGSIYGFNESRFYDEFYDFSDSYEDIILN